MRTKRHCHLTLDENVVGKAREIAGLVPFSRFVEELLKREIEGARDTGGEAEP